MLVQCMLSSTNGHWSCPGMPGRGIPDIGVAANWVLGMVSPLLGQSGPCLACTRSGTANGHCLACAGLLGIIKDTEACQLLLSTIATHQAVVATGCWLFMALLLLAVHGIIILTMAMGSGLATLPTHPYLDLRRH